MGCLHCGKQLAFLRRWTGRGEFCSEAHKQSYNQEFNKLALTRLIQGQSEPAAYPPADPQHEHPGNAVGFPEHGKKISARDSEQGWTTVQRAAQKRLPAPVSQAALPVGKAGLPVVRAALPAAPARKEAPGRADFLVDKPQLQPPTGTEPPALVAFPLLAAHQPYQPRLCCSQTELHAVAPPSRADLVELPSAPPFAKLQTRPVAIEPAFTKESQGALRTALTLNTRPVAAFERAGLLPFEIELAAPAQPATELQPPYNFDFQIVAGGIPDSVKALASQHENVESCDPSQARRLLDLMPLNGRPTPLRSRDTRLQFQQLPVRTSRPRLPASTPFVFRPRVAAADPKNAASEFCRSTISTKVSVVERESVDTGNQVAVGSGADLPGFSKDVGQTPSRNSVWGSVHKYLKDIVGCLLLATLGGGYYWHLSAAKLPNPAQPAAELAGEADRAKPERQIFIYPASMLVQDYRVDFEVPLLKKGSNWMFRVTDPGNYYGMRLESERDGAVLRWKIRKYVQIEGQQTVSETVRLPHTEETDDWRITLEVQGSQFRTYVQGRLIDKWTDARFTRGGFGSYVGQGEPLPIRSVRVEPLEPSSSRGAYRRD